MATTKQVRAARRHVRKAQAAASSKRTIAHLPKSTRRAGEAGGEGPAARRQGRSGAGGPEPTAALRGGEAAEHPGSVEDGEVGPDRGDPKGRLRTGFPLLRESPNC